MKRLTIRVGLAGLLFAFAMITGCSDSGGSGKPSKNISITGSVSSGDSTDVTVTLKPASSEEMLGNGTCHTDGSFTLSVERSMVSKDTDYLLTAENASNGQALRSYISGADILAVKKTFSSALTAISMYSEAACILSEIKGNAGTSESFLKTTLRQTDSGLPLSTGDDVIDALAVWLHRMFNDADAETGSSFRLKLLQEIIRAQWPTLCLTGSTVSLDLPSELMAGGTTISVTTYTGADAISVSENTITITTGTSESQGQAEILMTLGDTSLSVTLPVNTIAGEETITLTASAGDASPLSTGNLTLIPSTNSFPESTAIQVTPLDITGLAGTQIGGAVIANAWHIQPASRPISPVTLVYQADQTPGQDNTVLIHINPATKTETWIWPDSYDAQTYQFTFTLAGFSPIFIATLPESPDYTNGSLITVSDLQTDPINAFGFMRQLCHFLNNVTALNVSDADTRIQYLRALSGKALASFMAIPTRDIEELPELESVTFSPNWYSLNDINALSEYWALRSDLMQVLYKITNAPFIGLTATQLQTYNQTHNVDIESDINASVLGKTDSNGNYYFPMMAYRVLKKGLTSPDSFFDVALSNIDAEGMDASAFNTLYKDMATWIEAYIKYTLFTSPKVSKTSRTAVENSVVAGVQTFFSDDQLYHYAGIWLGGSFGWSQTNDVDSAMGAFSRINDVLGGLSLFVADTTSLRNTAQNDTSYPLGSAVNGQSWVSKGNYYIPPEVDLEITGLTHWQQHFLSLVPESTIWYRDADADGYGNPEDTLETFSQPEGYVSDNTDPNDDDATIYPSASEVCGDGVDNDLNGLIDEGCSTFYKGTEAAIPLKRKSNNQFLIPVDVGNQTLNLLVDTGSDALLVFADKLADDTTVVVSNTPVSKSYASTTRNGFLGTAEIRLGAYHYSDMKIMVVTSPTSDTDPSLTAKEADGIIGFRRTQGLSISNDNVYLDAPLNVLQPMINCFELNLPPSGQASLSLGHMATLDRAKPQYVFKTKTYTFKDPVRPWDLSFADLQVPFRAKSKFGEANTGELDVLFDSGAVSKLVLDTEVAKSLGYDPVTDTWQLDDNDTIEFNLVGTEDTINLYPKFKVSEVSVSPLHQLGVTYEAVLGIDRWQHYVVGFSYVDYQSGGPDGTMLMMFRPNAAEAFNKNLPGKPLNYKQLSGLNSLGDDRFPTADNTGDIIAFQSNRPFGKGGWDLYVWKKDTGLISFSNLNSTADDADPSLSGDGRYMVFHSNREGGMGNWDIYLYDFTTQTFVPTPGLNTTALERTPTISTDGRYIVFRSERDGGQGNSDIYLYDRDTSSLIDLTGANSAAHEYDPVVNSDGTLISFDREDPTAEVYDSNVYLYNVTTQTLDLLESVNTESTEMDGVVSPDGSWVTYQTNSHNLAMGLYDRNLMVYNRQIDRFEKFSGLNSHFDEEGLCFTGNSQNILFHSSRPGGKGGSDIYFYSLSDTDAAEKVTDTTIEALPQQSFSLTHDAASDSYTLAVATGDGQELTLLLDTGLSGVIAFEDKITSEASCGGPVSILLPQGTLPSSGQICTQIHIGNKTAQTRIPLIPSQSDYNTLVGRTDLPDVDGVIGFRGNFQNEFVPKILFMEYSFFNGKSLNLDVRPGITIGHTPLTSLAAGQGDYIMDTMLDGVIDPIDPYNKSYANMDVTFIAKTDTGDVSPAGNVIMLSTILHDTLLLDFETARSLGYSEFSGWGDVATVSIFFDNEFYMLPTAAEAYPVDKIQVRDLEDMHCHAVLSADRWMHQFIVGFITIDYQFGGPTGYISILNVKDIPALEGNYFTSGRNYIALPGLNSNSDEDYPNVSIDGQTIVFQSSRNGDKDIFVYRIGKGLLDYPGLNSDDDDEYPVVSGDGRLMSFHSNRSGNYDIYLFDLVAGTFIDLPDLNTAYLEQQASISADGTMMAFVSDRPESIEGSWDIYLYSLETMSMVTPNGSWLNTNMDESGPILNSDASLVSFVSDDRPDSVGSSDFYLYDLENGRLVELPEGVNSEDWNDGVVSSDGDYILGTYYPGENGDIRLFERSSGEFIYLPGLNTVFDDWALQVTPNAQFVVFESDRPGGQGGYDIYLYQRDETDTSTYTVTNTYGQNGYVTDADGNRVVGEDINVYDKSGKMVGTGTTDSDGNFTITIPQGVQLPMEFETSTSGLFVVTDDVGDDTYVPDFEAGNLKFTEVWVEDTAQAGLASKIHFNIETTVPKYNTFVTVYLKAGNPGDVIIDSNFEPDYELTSLVIDKLGFRGDVTEPIVKDQQDVKTAVTYETGNDNKKAYVEHDFIVPQGIPDGTYTAVFAINTYDVTSEDDALQGETDEDKADNFMVASAATIIGNPDKPNLRILSHKLYTNSFELPEQSPDPVLVPEYYDLSLNLEVESMAQDATLPVDITFDLEIDGQLYPMTIADSDGYSGRIKAEKQTYPVTCREEDREGYPEGDRCAALYRQEQTGKTYNLYMNTDAYDVLEALAADSVCTLVVKMDPDQTIDEFENNRDDNTVRLPVMFLAPEASEEQAQQKMSVQVGSSEGTFFNLRNANSFGNANFGMGYEIGPKMTYRSVEYDGMTVPYAANFDGTGKVNGTLFGYTVTPLDVGPSFEFDFHDTSTLKDAYLEYHVKTFGVQIWGFKHTMPWDFQEEGTFTFWDTQDDDGNEKYAKRKEKKKSKKYMVGYVPVTVEGGVVGEIGIRGALTFGSGNKLGFEAGPFASLKGFLEGSVGVPGFQVGVGVELILIELSVKFDAGLMLKPSVPIAIIELRVPFNVTTLKGAAYIFARAFLFNERKDIIAWDGYSYDINLFPLYYKGYGATDLYNSSYYPSDDWSGTMVAGPREGVLLHDWEYGGPAELDGRVDYFSAIYQGWFEFSATDSYIWGDSSAGYGSTYTFYADSDDYLTVQMDGDDILTDNFGIKQFDQEVQAGFHELTVNYKELHSPAHLQLYWTAPNQFATFYYNNTDFSGDPVLFETTNQIDMKLGSKSPKPGIVNADNFSVKYEGDFTFPATTEYIFSAQGDDVVRIYLDNVLVLDNSGFWYIPFASTVNVTAGTHKVRVEYIEYTGWANLSVGWAPKNTFVGAYFNNRTFKDNAKVIRDDSSYLKADAGLWDEHFLYKIDHARPHEDVHYDDFSVKWGGAFYFEGGDYEFVISPDNEMSVWIDGESLGSYTTGGKAYLVTKYISPGWHIIRMNYVEHYGIAVASLKWGKKKKNIVTEYYGRHNDEYGNLICEAINRRTDMTESWGNSAPTTDEWGLAGDDFNIIWEGDFDFDGAPYRFILGADDHITLYIDGVKIKKAQWGHYTSYASETIAMNKGTHHIKAVMRENGGGAYGDINWTKLEPNKFYGLKYDDSHYGHQNTVDTGTNEIDYNWVYSGPKNPDDTLKGSVDNFMIEWTGVFDFASDGDYYFTGRVDDSLELYLDNVRQTFEWTDKTGTWSYSTINHAHSLKKGVYSVKVRYFEGNGKADVAVKMHKK